MLRSGLWPAKEREGTSMTLGMQYSMEGKCNSPGMGGMLDFTFHIPCSNLSFEYTNLSHHHRVWLFVDELYGR